MHSVLAYAHIYSRLRGFQSGGNNMGASLAWLETSCRQILSVLPADHSLGAITLCAVIYGALCLLASKAVLTGLRFILDRLLGTAPRPVSRTAS